MKKCPKCGQTYDDSWKICFRCSVNLSDDLSAKESNPELRKTYEKIVPVGINIGGIFGIFCGIFFIVGVGFGGSFSVTGVSQSLQHLAVFASIGISLIISGTFIMQLREWARKLFIFQMCIIASYGIWYISVARNSYFAWSYFIVISIISLPMPIFCLYYLTRPKVKEQFK